MKAVQIVALVLGFFVAAHAQTTTTTEPCVESNPPISPDVMKHQSMQVSVGLISAIIGVCFVIGFTFYVLRQPDGTEEDVELRQIAGYIHDGARTFLHKEYIALLFFVIAMCIIMGSLFAVLEYCCLGQTVEAVMNNERHLKLDNLSGLWMVIALLLGALLSAAAGYLGMFIATKANIRTTHACRQGMGNGLSVAFKSGAVMGLTVCCLGVIGLSILYLAYSNDSYFLRPWTYIAGFGFGASSIALFARVGGGVYTKAADVGADLVGKVENNIPEDDVRNPATIADNVGDNVGDVAGMGADLFESYSGSIIAACSLAAVTVVQATTTSCSAKCDPIDAGSDAAYRGCIYGIPALGTRPAASADAAAEYWFEYCPKSYGMPPLHYVRDSEMNANAEMGCSGYGSNGQYYYHLFALPFWIAGVGILSSIIGVFSVTTDDESVDTSTMTKQQKNEHDIEQLEALLWKTRIGVIVAAVISSVASLIVCLVLFFGTEGQFEWRFFGCMLVGLFAGIFIGVFTEYCTSYSYYPTKSISESSETGPATVIIRGLGVGMISCAVPTFILVIAILASDELAGVYGISIAAVGMLSTLGVTLATDAYGPVADNAGGIAEMVDTVDDEVRERTDALDALGNTTAATGKGFAIGSAVLTSVGLITAFMEEAGLSGADAAIDLKEPVVLCGILIGAMLPYLFAALTMLSVGSSAESIILQVRLQFYQAKQEFEHKDPNWWATFNPTEWAKTQEHKSAYKWYETCIAVSTNAALREMILPGLIAVFMPAIIGFILGSGALAGLLVGSLTSGFMLAIMMANAGGAWDNAKKYCEKELLGEGKGKGTSYHDATVVGDTVGDPFKDTSGPALNILIKLMSIMSLVLAPVFFMLYGKEVRPFVGDATRSVAPWVAPVVGVIILIVVVVICVVFAICNGRYNAAFRKNVETEMIKSSGGDSSSGEVELTSINSAFCIETIIPFTSEEGAKKYEAAFEKLAKSRSDYCSVFLLTRIDGGEGIKYVEFMVFKSSDAFKAHIENQSEGTEEMKEAMKGHVNMEKVEINVLGRVSTEVQHTLEKMGAHYCEQQAGYVNDNQQNENPVIVVSEFNANDDESVDAYANVFRNVSNKISQHASTFLLTRDPKVNANGLREVLIYRSQKDFEEHVQADVVRDQLSPALSKYIATGSVRVKAIGQEKGTSADTTFSTVDATYSTTVAGYKQ